MPINPDLIEIKKVTELPDLAIAITNYFAHCKPDGVLGKATMQALAAFIAPYVASVGSSGYIAVTGTVLPNPTLTASAFTIVGAGTFTQTTGGSVITTQPLNVLSWNGTTWSITVAIPIDLTNYVQKNDADYVKAIASVKQNDLTDAESAATDLGRWSNVFGSPTFAIVSGKLRITFTAGISQAIGIPSILSANTQTSVSLKIKVVSGTPNIIKVGFFSSTINPGTLSITPTATESVYTGSITPTIDAAFSVGISAANNTGQVIEIDDIFSLRTNPLITRISAIETNVSKNLATYNDFAGNLNILDSDTSNMNGTGGSWVISMGAPTMTFASGLMSLTFVSGNQYVSVGGIFTIGKTYTVKVKVRKASGTILKVRCGSFSTTPTPGNFDVILSGTSTEYTKEIVADSTYFGIGALNADNTGGILEVDYVIIASQGTVVDLIDQQISDSGEITIKSVFSETDGVFASLSRYDKPLTKIGVLGDSLMANPLGGSIPSPDDEGDTFRPIRLTYNNIARRLYDMLSYNKATHLRLDAASWTKNGVWSPINNNTIFEPTYSNETYFENSSANSYIEIAVPSGRENFAFICQRITGASALTITLNGGSISAYGPTSVTCNISTFGHTGNTYYTVQYLGLPTGVNTIRIARDNTTAISRIWGGFHWTGNTMVVHNISHGGHTVNDLLQNHAAGEIGDNNFDAILFELPIMNDAARVTDAGNTIAASKAALTTLFNSYLNNEDLLVMSCNPYGTDPSDGTPNYYTLYPGMEEMKDGLKTVVLSRTVPFIDVFEVFKRKITNRGGTLIGGEGGLWYTTDGQHGNPEGVREWWNIIKSTLDDNPITNF